MAENNQQSAPMVRVGTVYENLSKTGDKYYAGNFGAVRVLMFRSKKNEAAWNVLIQERPFDQPRQQAEKTASAPAPAPQWSTTQRPIDDEIPF